MADTPFCHTCGKASACSALMAYQSTGELPMTDTSTPILSEVVRLQAALIALNDVVIDLGKRTASLVEGGAPITCRFLESDSDVALPSGQSIPKDMLATVHEGNAVVPSAAYCPATGQFTLPPDPYQRDAVGAVTGLAPKDPEASAAPASQSVEMPGEVASPSYPPAASSL